MNQQSTHRRFARPLALRCLLALLAALLAMPAFGGIFTVTLDNGTTFETRYRPVEAEWDDDVALLMTDQGNWIALRKDEIVDVISETEESGFGYQVNTTTIFLGFTPNDLVDDEAEAGDEAGGEPRAPQAPRGAGAGGATGFGYGAAASSYSLDQFVDPIGGGTIPNGPSYGGGPENNTRIE
ncbi:MAG: hypothetical protein AAGC60_22160 [Acidobacteriota bacterium]